MADDTLVQQDTLDTSTTRDSINLNNGGVPLLNKDGKIYDAYLPAVTGAVTSVNGQTGDVIVNAGDVSYNSTSKKLTYNQGASNVYELNIGSDVSLSNGVITTNDLRSSTATISSNITTPKIYGGSSSSTSLTLQPTSYGSYPNYLTISESAGLTTGIELMSSGSLNLVSDYGINLSGSGGLDISVTGDVSISSAGSNINIGSGNNVNVQCGGTFLYRNSEVLTRDNISSGDSPKLNINKYNSEGYMPDGASGTAPDMSNSMNNMGFYVAAYYPLVNNVFRIWLSDKQQEMLLADDADGSGFTNKAGNAASIQYEGSEHDVEDTVGEYTALILGYTSSSGTPKLYFTFYNHPQCENGLRAYTEDSDFYKDEPGLRTAFLVKAEFSGNNKGLPPVRYDANQLKGSPFRYGIFVSDPITPVTVSSTVINFQSLGMVDLTISATVSGTKNNLYAYSTLASGTENVAAGVYSTVLGRKNISLGYASLTAGQNNISYAEKSFIAGSGNSILEGGTDSIALGRSNIVTGSSDPEKPTPNVAIGYNNEVTNKNEDEIRASVAIGDNNKLTSTDGRQIAIGYNNEISSSGAGRKLIFGGSNEVKLNAIDSCVVGFINKINTTGSYAFGTKLSDITAQESPGIRRNIFVLGCNNNAEDLVRYIGASDKARIAFGVGVSYNDVKKTGLMISEAGNLWLGGSIINMLGSDNNRYRLSIDVTGGTPTLVITQVS